MRCKANKSLMAILDSYQNKFLIIIAGPTAVGKSNLAFQLAKVFDAEIFSADSRQVYHELTIGTAKPSAQELITVKHHFVNHISIASSYSVGQFEQECKAALDAYFVNRDIAVLVGGTGLYIKALLEGMDDFPDVSSEISSAIQDLYDDNGIDALREELLKNDPIYYNMVDKNNHRRMSRALGVCWAAQMPYSNFLNLKKEHHLPFQPIMILLDMDRDLLYTQINDRVDTMMANGLEDEAKGLYPYRHFRALDTVGYTELFDYFDQKSSYQQSIELIKQNTRRYAKRQLTWFRKHGDWQVFKPDDADNIVKYVKNEMI